MYLNAKFVLAVATGALLSIGCTARERAEQHEKSARDNAATARQELRDGEKKAQQDLIDARKKADKDFQDAREEQAKADEARRDVVRDRQPVAGRDDDRPLRRDDATPFVDDLRGKLGDGWMVEKQAIGFLAVRKHDTRRAASDFRGKMDDQIRSLRNDQHGANAIVSGDEVKLRGSFDHCKNAVKWMDKFAGVDGINRIRYDATCNKD